MTANVFQTDLERGLESSRKRTSDTAIENRYGISRSVEQIK